MTEGSSARVVVFAVVLVATSAIASPSIQTSGGQVDIVGTDVCQTTDAGSVCSSELVGVPNAVAAQADSIASVNGSVEGVIGQLLLLRDEMAATNSQQAAALDAAESRLASSDSQMTATIQGISDCAAVGQLFDAQAGGCDVNECTMGTDNCHEDAVCRNTVGSFSCTCPDALVGNGTSCRPLEPCGRDRGDAVCRGPQQLCAISSDNASLAVCYCQPGHRRIVGGDGSGSTISCRARRVTTFQDVAEEMTISSFYFDGTNSWHAGSNYIEMGRPLQPPRGKTDPFMADFFRDQCADGNAYLKHSIDCGYCGYFLNQNGCPCRAPSSASSQDTDFNYNFFEFRMQQPVAVNEWRVRSRRHGGSIYMGATSLMALDERTNTWISIGERGNREPGPCQWTEWSRVQYMNNNKYSSFRFRTGRNSRTAYESFAALGLSISPMPHQDYRFTRFEDAIKTVTYAPTFLRVNASSAAPILFPNHSNLFNDECQCLRKQIDGWHPTATSDLRYVDCGKGPNECCDGANGGPAVVSEQGATNYGEQWILFEMKVPVEVTGFRLKARRAQTLVGSRTQASPYLSQVQLLGSHDGVNFVSLSGERYHAVGEYKAYGCQYGPDMEVTSSDRYKFYKLELWRAGTNMRTYTSQGQDSEDRRQSFNVLQMYMKQVPWGDFTFGLVDYYPFETTGGANPLQSIAGDTHTAISINGCNRIINDENDGPSGGYAHRMHLFERVGACRAGPYGGMYKGGWTFPLGRLISSWSVSFWWRMVDQTCHNSRDCAGLFWVNAEGFQGKAVIAFGGSSMRELSLWSPAGGRRPTGYTVEVGTWYHMTLTVEAQRYAFFYLNGKSIAEDHRHGGRWTLGPNPVIANYANGRTGNTNNHYARGDLDELAIWQRAITPGEVAEVYRATNAGHMPV